MTYKELEIKIKNANNIVFFSGAGMSTESGLKDFRSDDGLYSTTYKGFPPEVILSNKFFFENTEIFYDYYKKFFLSDEVKPNYGHRFIAELEAKNKNITVITQNIDGLHQLAGSSYVLELHGSVYRNYTVKNNIYIEGTEEILNSKGIPNINGDIIKPDVVLYGEPLKEGVFEKAAKIVSEADLLIILGTSLTVHPASYLINYIEEEKTVSINKENLHIKNQIIGSISETFKKIKL